MNVHPIVFVAAILGCLGAGYGAGYLRYRRKEISVVRPTVQASDRVRTLDRNGDGRPDQWTILDNRGRPERIQYDDDHNGQAERWVSLTTEGKVLSVYFDRNWNDRPERWEMLDVQGHTAAEWTDVDENTVPEEYREWDRNGKLVQLAIDHNQDGRYEQSIIYNPSWGDGVQSMVETDSNGDQVMERREMFDRNGALVSIELDTDGDGRRDLERRLNPDGSLIKERYDRNTDGFFEETRIPVAGGQMRTGHDDDHDGDIDRWNPPGPPDGWCAARCVVRDPSTVVDTQQSTHNPAVNHDASVSDAVTTTTTTDAAH